MLETKAGENAGQKNAELFKEELNSINEEKKIGAKISYDVIPSEFITSQNKFNSLYMKLIKTFEGEEELYADITFGPKALPQLIFTAMQFGEKFFDCSIGNVIYLKTEFGKNNVIKPDSQLICDYTHLYLLSSFNSVIEASSGEKAVKAFEILLKE